MTPLSLSNVTYSRVAGPGDNYSPRDELLTVHRLILRSMAVLFWLIIILVCIFAEIHTNAFITVFIGIGAIVPFFLAIASVPFAVQAVLWIVISGILLAALRPAALHRFQRKGVVDLSAPSKSSMTNLTGFVENTVGDEGHPGSVKIKGESWRAVTEAKEAIPDGTQVIVKKTYGTTLWVEPVTTPS
jgi:membrane protein implicated in regulation of membrane protease activity